MRRSKSCIVAAVWLLTALMLGESAAGGTRGTAGKPQEQAPGRIPKGAGDGAPLKLVQTIRLEDIRAQGYAPAANIAQEVQTSRMANVRDHFDHFEVDLRRRRLFVTPEDHKRLDVYDLRSGKPVRIIGGIGRAHSVLYRPDLDEVFLTDGDVGSLKIFKGRRYRLMKEVRLLVDADAIGYDPSTHYLYIDNGGLDAGINYCVLSIVNTNTGRHVGDIRIDSNRVEAMVVEKGGPRIFLNMVEKSAVAVIDRTKRVVVATWPVTGGRINVGIALDEEHHRLFVACREGKLMVLDSDTGKVLQTLPIATGVDDMVYDPVRRRIYVACGEGFVNVFEQIDADHYRLLGAVPTGPLGKTGRLVPELNRYFVAVPPHGETPAEVLVFEVQ